MITKSSSCNEIWTQRSQEASANSNSNSFETDDSTTSKKHKSSDEFHAPNSTENHKTVIYFGDSLSNRRQANKLHRPNSVSPMNGRFDLKHANRLCDEMIYQHQKPPNRDDSIRMSRRSEKSTLLLGASVASNSGSRPTNHIDFVHMPSSAAVNSNSKSNGGPLQPHPPLPPLPPLPPPQLPLAYSDGGELSDTVHSPDDLRSDEKLPSFIESIVNGVISIKIDSSYDVASKLLHSIENGKSYDKIENNYNDMFSDVDGESNNAYLDWSFVQDWRTR